MSYDIGPLGIVLYVEMILRELLLISVVQRPYHVERTGSRPITEVKQHWARLVLRWVTAWEHRVLLFYFVLWYDFFKLQ